jgi:AcrR family transcriptional regulator
VEAGDQWSQEGDLIRQTRQARNQRPHQRELDDPAEQSPEPTLPAVVQHQGGQWSCVVLSACQEELDSLARATAARLRQTASVPKTRPALDRDTKVSEIVEAATRQLLDAGYGSLSIAGLARELGLAPNSIYWYFPEKDQLVIACVRQIVSDLIASKPPARKSVEGRVLWFVEQVEDLKRLRAELYQRARDSPAMSAFVEELENGQREMLGNVLKGQVVEKDRALARDALIVLAEGAALRDLDPQRTRELIAYALRRYMATTASG